VTIFTYNDRQKFLVMPPEMWKVCLFGMASLSVVFLDEFLNILVLTA